MGHADTELPGAFVPAPEETVEQRLPRAKGEGSPWAQIVGSLPDDDLTQARVAEMQTARQKEEGNAMQIPVLIQPLGADRFRATGGAPLSFSAEGATRDEAVAHLSRLVHESLASGAEVVSLSVPVEDPLARFAGSLCDNPLFDDWVEAMREFRKKMDNETFPWEE